MPPGIRVEAGGFGVTHDEGWDGDLAADAPVVHITAFADKGRVETRTTPKH
ncbi:MAG: hypothetical protein ACJ72W_19395 [Actinoallomurus sp.]